MFHRVSAIISISKSTWQGLSYHTTLVFSRLIFLELFLLNKLVVWILEEIIEREIVQWIQKNRKRDTRHFFERKQVSSCHTSILDNTACNMEACPPEIKLEYLIHIFWLCKVSHLQKQSFRSMSEAYIYILVYFDTWHEFMQAEPQNKESLQKSWIGQESSVYYRYWIYWNISLTGFSIVTPSLSFVTRNSPFWTLCHHPIYYFAWYA
jgi:hypothetical protein